MSGVIELLSALVTKLRTESTITNLVSTIISGDGTKTITLPRVVCEEILTQSIYNDGFSIIKESIINIHCLAKESIDAIRIADKIEELLRPASSTDYYDISVSGLRNTHTAYLRTQKKDKNEKEDYYEKMVFIEIQWVGEEC